MPSTSTTDEPLDGTLAGHLQTVGASCEPCNPEVADHPRVSVPQLPGWEPVPADLFPNAYHVLVNPSHREQEWAPNVVLLHGRLTAPVDAEALLACGGADSRALPEWHEHVVSRAPHQGHPSAFIQGSYTVNDRTFAATNRYVVSSVGSSQFLTQLTVTIFQSQAEELDVDVVVFNSALNIAMG
ncbi:LpqN/LpqT family lipoprotein [Rhodococcus sp. WMMA185]|uniref:LpqN/LpqT family lipoprotein n=1 Tax=Rhodococcus sp. WMMA185 TaxID=679318 RepID=UPI000A026D7F|nr:LpqN/LpqT family lipoprotein [Rhodococcus sp. WMMA185]